MFNTLLIFCLLYYVIAVKPEENSEMLPPLQLPSGSPQFSYRGVLPSTHSLRSPGGDNIDSSVHSLESTREAMRGDSVLFLQNFLDKKNLEKSPSFLMLTVYKNGEHFYTSMTLRDLLKLVQQEVAPLCKASFTHDDDVMAVGQAKYRDIRRLESILSAHEEPAILVSCDLETRMKHYLNLAFPIILCSGPSSCRPHALRPDSCNCIDR